MEEQTTAIHNWTAIIRKYSDLQEVDRTIVEELIDHIEVGERTNIDGQRHQDIKVFYRFVGLVWRKYIALSKSGEICTLV